MVNTVLRILNIISYAFVNINFISLQNNVLLEITSKQLWKLWIDFKDNSFHYALYMQSGANLSKIFLKIRFKAKQQNQV